MTEAITIQIALPPKLMNLLERFVVAQEKIADLYAGLDDMMAPPPADVVPAPQAPPTVSVIQKLAAPAAPSAPLAPSPEAIETLPSNAEKWSDERLLLLECEWRRVTTTDAKERLLARVNALLGKNIVNVAAMMAKVYSEGWHKTPSTALPPPTAAQSTPAAPPQPAAENPWSDARKARLKTMWEADDEVSAITASLNRLEGPTLVENAVIRKAGAMMLVRPRSAPPTTPARPQIEINGPATIEEIKSWFRSVGGVPETIPTEERFLVAANALRERLGGSPFEVRR